VARPPSGYSGKPLVAKLGFRPGETVYLVAAPTEFADYLRSEGVEVAAALPATWCHAFFTASEEVRSFLARTSLDRIEQGLWVSWPKRASKVRTDLTEQTFRDLVLDTGWVDVKVAAVDDVWSGLKFLRRRTR
jgi:hypothetical protein